MDQGTCSIYLNTIKKPIESLIQCLALLRSYNIFTIAKNFETRMDFIRLQNYAFICKENILCIGDM